MNNKAIRIEEARLIIKSHSKTLLSETISLKKSVGRITSNDVIATIEQQPFNNSAMDGFAVRSSDITKASITNNIKFSISKSIIAAGSNILDFTLKETNKENDLIAIKIMTGAALPKRYDVVIPVEDANIDNSSNILIVDKPYVAMYNVRSKGEDFKKGDVLVKKGEIITPYNLMLLKASGINNVEVFKKPRLAIITTGTEFNNENEKLSIGKIYNSSALFLEEFFNQNNFEVTNLGNVVDNKQELRNLIESNVINNFDIVVSTGAVSKGDFDIIPNVLKDYGKVLYHFLTIKPGKPNLLVKLQNGTLWFGLPGNPVSTVVGARLFILYYYLCATFREEQKLLAVLNQDVSKKAGLTLFNSGQLKNINGLLTVDILPKQGSHIISSLANSDVLIELNSESTLFPKGSLVPFYYLTNL